MKTVVGLVLALATMQAPETFDLRGQIQTLHLYGPAKGEPVIVSSGDGGWVHLAPHIASVLARRGFFVVGFDAKAYLASFTSKQRTLDAAMEAKDYAALAGFAARATGKKPILVGVSEGGGLSLLAATDARTKTLDHRRRRRRAAGRQRARMALAGFGDLLHAPGAERADVQHRDHRRERDAAAARRHPFHDATSSSPLRDIQRIVANANEPKRLWIVKASDHSFSDNRDEFDARLFEAIDWVKQHAPK